MNGDEMLMGRFLSLRRRSSRCRRGRRRRGVADLHLGGRLQTVLALGDDALAGGDAAVHHRYRAGVHGESAHAEEVRYPAHRTIVSRGARGDSFFVIAEGEATVRRGTRKIGSLGPGDFFGEMALLSGARRSADVTATDYCQFLTLDQREFRSFVARNPRLREQLDALVAQRSAMNRDKAEPASAPVV